MNTCHGASISGVIYKLFHVNQYVSCLFHLNVPHWLIADRPDKDFVVLDILHCGEKLWSYL